MNTHLHILEPYTNLYRVWKSPELEKSIRGLLHIFMDKLFNPDTHHLDLFFDDEWKGKRNIQSYGHDIEASWLLYEAVLALGDKKVQKKIEPVVKAVAEAADEGLQPDGSMVYEHWVDSGKTDDQRQWWVLCEAVIGHINLYQYFGDKNALAKAEKCWEYIKKYLIDYKNGEWHWSVDGLGNINFDDDKVGFWKCPYHNSRMCLEIIQRL